MLRCGKRFTRYLWKKLRYGALFILLLLAFSLHFWITVNFRLTAGVTLKMPSITDYSASFHMLRAINETNDVPEPVCNTKDVRTDVCEISGDVRIDSGSASVIIVSSDQDGENMWKIQPYPRKEDPTAMESVREWSVKSTAGRITDIPQCNRIHRVPAIFFSTGGYSGNNFHDFTDILIPLYLTARQYNGEVKLLITDDEHSWWNVKFHKFLKKLSRYDLIKIDREKGVHCFQNAILGLKRHHGELMIDSSRSPYTMTDFRKFLRASYSLQKGSAIKIGHGEKQRPQLLIIARKPTRAFTNTEEITKMARKLGFEVLVAEPADRKNVSQFAEIVNSCDVMMGVHGAGLTNMVFLPENAVMIEVVPIGLERMAKSYHERPLKDMNIRYLKYNIEPGESSLIEQFPPGHLVLKNPASIRAQQGWYVFKSIYLSNQNVKLNINRFRPTLFKALELLHQ